MVELIAVFDHIKNRNEYLKNASSNFFHLLVRNFQHIAIKQKLCHKSLTEFSRERERTYNKVIRVSFCISRQGF